MLGRRRPPPRGYGPIDVSTTAHTDGLTRDLANTGGKIVFYVVDPVATVELARDRGAQVVREATPVPEFDDAVIAFVEDPDGHLVEILQA